MRVVAVDDDTVNRMVFGGFLRKLREERKLEFEYDTASNGMEALQLCVENQYDLVFMDIMMPEMNGVECVGAIRQIYKKNGWKEPLCVMVTACDKSEMAMKARDAGAVGYLMKPVERSEIIDWIQMAIMGGASMGKPGDLGL